MTHTNNPILNEFAQHIGLYEDIPVQGARKMKRYNDEDVVTALNSQLLEMRRKAAAYIDSLSEQVTEKNFGDPTEQQADLRRKIEHALSVDWAFGTKHGEIGKEFNGSKPERIVIQGYPKGAYHTSYEKFIDELLAVFAEELEKRESSKVQIVHVEHREIGGKTFTCLYDDKGEKYLHLKKYELDTSFKPSFGTDAEFKVSHLIGREWKPRSTKGDLS